MFTWKRAGIALGVLFVFYLLKEPVDAAEMVNGAARGLGKAADALSEFVTALG